MLKNFQNPFKHVKLFTNNCSTKYFSDNNMLNIIKLKERKICTIFLKKKSHNNPDFINL